MAALDGFLASRRDAGHLLEAIGAERVTTSAGLLELARIRQAVRLRDFAATLIRIARDMGQPDVLPVVLVRLRHYAGRKPQAQEEVE